MEKAKGKKLFYRPAGKRKGMYTPTQIICVSFVIVIALGTFLLSLPVASKHGRLGCTGCHVHRHKRYLRYWSDRAGYLDPVHLLWAGGDPAAHSGGWSGVGHPHQLLRAGYAAARASAICGCWEKASQRTDMRRPRTC